MAFKGRNDLVTKALGNLGVTATGQPVDTEDFETVDDFVDSLLRSLAAQEIVYVPDPDSIPEEWFLQLAALLAHASKTEFGLAPEEIQKIDNERDTAEAELRNMVRGRPTYEPLRTVYF